MVPPMVNGVVVQVTATVTAALVIVPLAGTGAQFCVGVFGCVTFTV